MAHKSYLEWYTCMGAEGSSPQQSLLLQTEVLYKCFRRLYELIQRMPMTLNWHCSHPNHGQFPHHEAQEASHHLPGFQSLGCGGSRAVWAPILNCPNAGQSYCGHEPKPESRIACDALYGISCWHTLHISRHRVMPHANSTST